MTDDGYGQGLDFLQEQSEKLGSRRGNRMLKLWLRDGEATRFWFLTDGNDAAVPLIHVVPRTRRDGTIYQKDVLCAKRSEGDDAACRFCDDPLVDRGPWARGCFLVYVTEAYHPTKPGDKDWEVVQSNMGVNLYREIVNDTWLLIGNLRTLPQIQKAYNGDPLDDSYDPEAPKTLLGNEFQLSRQGENKSINEDLRKRPASDMPERVREALENKPDINDVVYTAFHEEPSKEELAAWKRGGGSGAATGAATPADAATPDTPAASDDEELIAF